MAHGAPLGLQPLPSALRSPIIIGGAGGSGTRAAAFMLHLSGVLLSGDSNYDARILCCGQARLKFAVKGLGRLNFTLEELHESTNLSKPTTSLGASLRQELTNYHAHQAHLLHNATHCARAVPHAQARPWAIKHPYSLAFLPWLHALAPKASYVLVVRDGRDVALPNNHAANKMLELGLPLLPANTTADAPRHELLLRIWARFNLQMEASAMAHGANLTVLRTDCEGAAMGGAQDVCVPPTSSLTAILTCAGRTGLALLTSLRACSKDALQQVAEQTSHTSLGSSSHATAGTGDSNRNASALPEWRLSKLSFRKATADPVVRHALVRYGYEI